MNDRTQIEAKWREERDNRWVQLRQQIRDLEGFLRKYPIYCIPRHLQLKEDPDTFLHWDRAESPTNPFEEEFQFFLANRGTSSPRVFLTKHGDPYGLIRVTEELHELVLRIVNGGRDNYFLARCLENVGHIHIALEELEEGVRE